MAKEVVNKLEKFAAEGDKLLEQGYTHETEEFSNWYSGCRRYLIATYGNKSRQKDGFKGSNIKILTDILRGYASQEEERIVENKGLHLQINQTQTTNIHQQISFQVQLIIEYSDLSEDAKQEAKELLSQIEKEVKSPKVNWQKVSDLLKKGFDYGLKIALPLAELAAKYYQAKGD